jgi:flavin-dependent dehydrogenase
MRVTGNSDTYEGTFVIGADGLNSRIASLTGLNKGRVFYGSGSNITCYFTGLSIPQSEAAIAANYFRPHTSVPGSFFIVPSPYADDEFWISIRTLEDFKYLTLESTFSAWFSDVRVRRVKSYVMSLWSPVSEPYKDNVLLVGDAAWFGEAEITGSMMCGWKAANAITVALKDNQPNREGVINYIEWWKNSFPEFDDYRNFIMFHCFCLLLSEPELNYLYSLIPSPLRSTLNPFLIARIVKKALEPLLPKVQKEMPSLIEKLQILEVNTIDKILREVVNKKSQENR